MKNKRELLFSVTAADCDWSYTSGTGPGGQAKNKSNAAVHCTHRASGAHGYCQDSRSQLDNKREAFVRMVGTKKFKEWHRLEYSKRTGAAQQLDNYVEQQMKKVRLEIKDDNGRWVEVDLNTPLDNGDDNGS